MENLEDVMRFLDYIGSENIDQMRKMVKEGFSPKDTENGGNSALILAADRGNEEMVQLLLESGEDVNYASDTGETALAAACFNGDIEIVKLLLARGASIEHVDHFGVSILDNASEHPELIAFLREYRKQQ